MVEADVLFDESSIRLARDVLPEPAVHASSYVTHLGDPVLLFVLVSLFYWFHGDRRAGAYVTAVALGGLSLLVGLKGLFERSRPPEEVAIVAADGYGFPSGHALGSAVVYLALAHHLDVSSRRRRYAGAVLLVVAVGASRIVLGVHYPGDVLAGFAVAAAYLAAVHLMTDRPVPVFAFALAAAVTAFAAGSTYYSGLSLGAPAGGLALWWLLGERLEDVEPEVRASAVAAAVVLPVALVLYLVLDGYVTSTTLSAAGYAVLVSVVLMTPMAAHLLHRRLDTG